MASIKKNEQALEIDSFKEVEDLLDAENEDVLSVYDKFIHVLETAIQKNLTSENIYENINLYNALYEAGYAFIAKVVLNKYHSMLTGVRLDRAEVANVCAAFVLFEKLNYILSPRDSLGSIKLINKTVKWRVIDLVRKEKRFLHGVCNIEDETDDKMDVATEESEETLFNELKDTAAKNVWHGKKTSCTKEGNADTVKEHADWKALEGDFCNISSEADLSIGDMVVHKKCGLGCYAGTEEIRANGSVRRYIKIAYDEKDTLFVPVSQLDIVAKYTGNRVTRAVFESPEHKNAEQNRSLPNVHLDNGWNAIASNENLEERAINSEISLATLDALKRKATMFEAVSFLSTKLIGYKSSELARDLREHGKAVTYINVFQQICETYNLDCNYFADAAFKPNYVSLNNSEIKEISARISHSSDRAKNKVRKIMSRSK